MNLYPGAVFGSTKTCNYSNSYQRYRYILIKQKRVYVWEHFQNSVSNPMNEIIIQVVNHILKCYNSPYGSIFIDQSNKCTHVYIFYTALIYNFVWQGNFTLCVLWYKPFFISKANGVAHVNLILVKMPKFLIRKCYDVRQ